MKQLPKPFEERMKRLLGDDLKKYELFIKGELEAMLEDDETVDI